MVMPVQCRQRRCSVRDAFDPETQVTQEAGTDFRDFIVIFNQQDAAVGRPARFAARVARDRRQPFRRAGNMQGDGRAFPDDTVDRDGPGRIRRPD